MIENTNIIKYLLIIIISSIFLISCSSFPRFSSESIKNPNLNKSKTEKSESNTGLILRGKASYYGSSHAGLKTASGEIFDPNKLTAAHKTLDFNTKIKVTNLENNKTVIVRINDRGPYVEGRIIDLSQAAAEQIGMIKSGVVEVELEILE